MIGVMAITGLATFDRAGDTLSVVAYPVVNSKTVRLENWMGHIYEPPPAKTNDNGEFSYWEQSELSEYDTNNLS